MKKSLIALAVASAVTAPMVAQADATLYGKFEMRVVSEKNVTTDANGNARWRWVPDITADLQANPAAAEDVIINAGSAGGAFRFTGAGGRANSVRKHDLEVQSDDFRIGIKGDADLGIDGVKGLFQYELEVNPDATAENTAAGDNFATGTFDTRLAYIGATGGFGTALIGRVGNPVEAVIKTGNHSEHTDYDFIPDRLGSAIAYVSPDMNGFNAYAAMVMEGQNDSDEPDVDGYLFGANYKADGLDLSAGYISVNRRYLDSEKTAKIYGLGAAYTFNEDMTTVALDYQQVKADFGTAFALANALGSDKTRVIGLKLSHKIDQLTLWANYHDFKDNLWKSQYGLGAVYALGSQGALDVEYVKTNGVGTVNGVNVNMPDKNIFSVGYNINF